MPISEITSGTKSAVNRSAKAGGKAVNSVTTTRISQTWFVSQTGPIARKIASRCCEARGPPASAVQTPAPKSAPPNIVYAMSPSRTTPAARFSGDTGRLLPSTGEGRTPESSQEQQAESRRQGNVDEQEQQEDVEDAVPRCGRVRRSHQMVDDPGLTSKLGDEPARLQGHESERSRRNDRQQQQPARINAPLPQGQTPEPRCHKEHEHADADHSLKREVRNAGVRDGVLREAVEAFDLGIEILERQEARQLRDFDGVPCLACTGIGDAAYPERRAALRIELGLHRSELLGLVVGEKSCAQ